MTHKGCLICGKAVGKPKRGPARSYCSKRCKAVAHERRWRAANPGKKREMNRRYYAANSEEILERHRKNRAESTKAQGVWLEERPLAFVLHEVFKVVETSNG